MVALQFSPSGNAADQTFRRDLQSMVESEKVAHQSAKEAFEALQSHQITESEFAQRLAIYVVPRWALIQSTFERDRVDDNSKLKEQWALFSDYADSRLAAFQLYESGARTGKKADIEKAKAKIDQGDIDLKLIRDLKQGRQQ